MRVALDGRVVTGHYPGLGRYVFRLAEALVEHQPEVDLMLVTRRGQTDSRFSLAELAGRPEVTHVEVESGPISARGQLEVRRQLRPLGADVFHAPYWLSAYWPGPPLVVSIHDLIGLHPAGGLGRTRQLALYFTLRVCRLRARAVITLSEASKLELTRWGVAADRITVTPLAPDPHFRAPPDAVKTELRRRLDLPERYILYLGSTKPHKNLATLVHAYGRLAELTEPVGLVVAGIPDARWPVPAELAGDRRTGIRLLGAVAETDLPALYAAADVFAFPSLVEGFGLPPLEAMACGTPVVAAATSSLPEVVGDAAICVDPADPAAWATALADVLAQPELAADLAKRGLSRAAVFTWRRTAEATVAAYRRALSNV